MEVVGFLEYNVHLTQTCSKTSKQSHCSCSFIILPFLAATVAANRALKGSVQCQDLTDLL